MLCCDRDAEHIRAELLQAISQGFAYSLTPNRFEHHDRLLPRMPAATFKVIVLASLQWVFVVPLDVFPMMAGAKVALVPEQP